MNYVDRFREIVAQERGTDADSADKTDVGSVLVARGNRYGAFTDHARVTQSIKAAMQDSPNWETLSDDAAEALEMIAHKIGRILCGDPEYDDSWVDIEGYARLVRERIQGNRT